MKRSFVIAPFLLLLLSGCGSLVQQQWHDFRAYYNTFYNARQYFNAGMEQNQSLQEEINPHVLIRIHPPPTSAGAEEFQIAIEKASDILRRHSRSRFVEDAVELIGISYFYRQEYFAAREKFQELNDLSTTASRRQQAVIWEGRTYLELGFYHEGVRFMEAALDENVPWETALLAEARAVLAQLFAYQESLYRAANQLLQALEDFEGEELRSRSWFHYGQIMNRIGNLEQAGFVFHEIQQMQTGFDLQMYARLMEADILRQQDRGREAIRRLQQMERDEKFSASLPEIRYELARTMQHLGETDTAKEQFQSVLYSPDRIASGRTTTPNGGIAPPIVRPEVTAKSYYQLAEIYRFHEQDYAIAAAYYDSAAAIAVTPDRLPTDWNAGELADAFGEYVLVQNEILHLEQLIEYGSLSEEELEERILERHRQHREALEEMLLRQEAAVAELPSPDELEETSNAGTHGFLNIHNRQRLRQARLQFQAIWGNPPLADHWRRSEARVDEDGREPRVESGEERSRGRLLPNGINGEEEGLAAIPDLQDIPRDETARDSLKLRMHVNYFRLGTILLINLDLPDRASGYFKKVLEGPEEAPKESSLYALADIALGEENEPEAQLWAQKLVNQYPDSRQARRISERMGWEGEGNQE